MRLSVKRKLYHHIEYEVRDSQGKMIRKGIVECKSWTYRLLEIVASFLYKAGVKTGTAYYCYGSNATLLTDTGGGKRRLLRSAYKTAKGAEAGVGDDSAGIVVGTNPTPFDPSQYNLLAKIPNGTGAGQLQYGAVTIENPSETLFRVIRTFSNSSGSPITVYEIGLIVETADVCNSNICLCTLLLDRTVVEAGIEVPDGSTLTLRYILGWT